MNSARGTFATNRGQRWLFRPWDVRFTPKGLLKRRTLLGERLNVLVRTTWSEVDVVRACLPANERIGPGDRCRRKDRPADKPLLDLRASLIVERDSQKGIMIGHCGSRLREIGAAARHQIEALLGTPVYLDLRLRVLKDWQPAANAYWVIGYSVV